MSNRGWANGGHFYAPQVKPVLLNCSFTVTPTNGLGITGLTGPGISNVFMHTSTTPTANNGITNPNPASGTIVVQLQEGYNRLLGFMHSLTSPASASDVKIDNSAMTAGVAYIITTLGNATAAKWLAIGVPAGVTPAVGVVFIAATNGGAGNTLTSRVQTALAAGAGVGTIQLLGNPNLSISPAPSANQGFGGQLIFQCRNTAGTVSQPTLTMDSYTPAGTNNGATPPIFAGTPAVLTGTVSTPTFTGADVLAAPAAGSIITLSLYLSDSSVTVQGQ